MMRFVLALAATSVPCLAAAQTGVSGAVTLFAETCLVATPPGLMEPPDGYEALLDRETFAGPAEFYWTRPGGDESVRVGVTFTTTERSCEFVVDDRALDPAALQAFGAEAILAIQQEATRQGAVAEVTAPENIPTFHWFGTPAQFSSPFEHRFEVHQSQTQTLIRGVISTTH